jgi:hypothetical protein
MNGKRREFDDKSMEKGKIGGLKLRKKYGQYTTYHGSGCSHTDFFSSAVVEHRKRHLRCAAGWQQD